MPHRAAARRRDRCHGVPPPAQRAARHGCTEDGANPAATIAAIHDALDQGLLTPADIDAAVKQNLALRSRLGEFDPGGGPGGPDGPATADEVAGARDRDRDRARDPAGRLARTWFRYGTLRTSASTVNQRGTVRLAVDVTNTGTVAGDEVVQLYTHQRTARVEQPGTALRGFQRVHLAPGQRKRVTFTLAGSDLRCWDVTRDRWVIEDATHDLLVGASPADIRATGRLRVRGETIPPRDLRRTTRAEHFDAHRGTTLLDGPHAGGTSVAATGAGQWVRYTDADLGAGPATFTGRFANAGAASTVQVRLDDPVRGPLLATVAVPATGGVDTWATATAALAGTSGRHDVYLVFGGPARLATFTLS